MRDSGELTSFPAGSELRLPAPPGAAATRAELAELRTLASQRTAVALDQITYWDAGSPGYRWNEIGMSQGLKRIGKIGPHGNYRMITLLNVAIYEATVAAWESKFAHNRRRPSEVDPTLTTVIPNPRSPSYPSEHAATAGAAAVVLSYVMPDDAVLFTSKAEEAARSRVLAGTEFPSDVRAGLELGRTVGERVSRAPGLTASTRNGTETCLRAQGSGGVKTLISPWPGLGRPGSLPGTANPIFPTRPLGTDPR